MKDMDNCTVKKDHNKVDKCKTGIVKDCRRWVYNKIYKRNSNNL